MYLRCTIYIDLTKAFDYLSRDALILKLQQRNVYTTLNLILSQTTTNLYTLCHLHIER